MAQNVLGTEASEKLPAPDVVASQFAAIGRKRIEEFFDARTELLGKFNNRTSNGSAVCNRRQILFQNLHPS